MWYTLSVTNAKKILILTLALWTGSSNFAYASAKIECASMMDRYKAEASCHEKVSASHSCCPKNVPCQCSIQAPSDERTAAVRTHVQFERPQIMLSSAVAETALPESIFISHNPFESPPQQIPLYQRFSVYRI